MREGRNFLTSLTDTSRFSRSLLPRYPLICPPTQERRQYSEYECICRLWRTTLWWVICLVLRLASPWLWSEKGGRHFEHPFALNSTDGRVAVETKPAATPAGDLSRVAIGIRGEAALALSIIVMLAGIFALPQDPFEQRVYGRSANNHILSEKKECRKDKEWGRRYC